MSIELETVACDLCGSTNNNLLLKARDYRYGHSEMFNVVKCKECGLIYLNPRPTARAVLELYKKDYTSNEKGDNLHKLRRTLKKILGFLWYKISGYYWVSEIKVKGRFLDIGCALGDTLEAARDMGADVYGIELNPNSVKICKEKGLNVHCGNVEDAGYPANYFDIVWMSQVIEHLPSPKDCLKEIKRILKPDGRLYVFCPNAGSYLAKLFGKYWHGWHVPFHFYGFNTKTMTEMAKNTGFVVKEIKKSTPDNFFIVSLKSYLFGTSNQRTKPIYRGRFLDTLIFRIFISPFLRILDFITKNGDCLKVELKIDNHEKIYI